MRRSKEAVEADRLREWRTLGYSHYSGYMKCSGCGSVTTCHGRSRRKVKCEECHVKGRR